MNSSTDEQTSKETRKFVWKLWQYEYIEFLIGGTKIRETKCPSINIPKRNYWILRIGVMGRFQKLPTYDFQSQFSMSTSPKGFSASKCDVGNWIFSKLGTFWEIDWNFFRFFQDFRRVFLGIFLEFFSEEFLGRIFLGGILCLYC